MTGVFQFASIVEGDGEREAVPALLRRLSNEFAPGVAIKVLRPTVRSRGELLHRNALEKDVELVARQVARTGALLILLDADDDCPASLGPALLARAKRARSDLRVGVVLANREYESWFLASAESLRGARGLPEDLEAPAGIEEIRGAKEWLQQRTSYSPTVDQAALTQRLDLGLARQRSPSFDKCVREFLKLVQTLAPTTP